MTSSQEHHNRQQIDLLAKMPVHDIPLGTDIPLEFFTDCFVNTHVPPILIELGAGDGRKADEVRSITNGTVTTVDINTDAVEKAQMRGLMGLRADIRSFDIFHGLGSLALLESYPGVFMQGVLCNQQLSDWQRVMTTANVLMRPGGYLLIADVIQPEISQEFMTKVCESEGGIEAYVALWRRRYQANFIAASALGIPVAYGEFMVAKPGEEKQHEWGDSKELISLYQSENLERWAHHIPETDIRSSLARLGFGQVRYEPRIWWSRPSGIEQKRYPLAGFVGIWQKGALFQYHPWYAGGTLADREERKEARKIASRADPDYIAAWKAGFKKNLPDAEAYFPSLFAYDTESSS